MIKAVPSSWVNQYNLTHMMLHKSPRQLLPDLENIERVMNMKRVEIAKAARAKDSAALAGTKSGSKKRASTGSGEQAPKKARTAKFCQHCKNNDRPYMFQNTKECCKYDKDGKSYPASYKKPYKKKPYKKHGGGDDKRMAYLQDTIKSLVKKGLKRKLLRRGARSILAMILVAIPIVNRNLGTVTRDYMYTSVLNKISR